MIFKRKDRQLKPRSPEFLHGSFRDTGYTDGTVRAPSNQTQFSQSASTGTVFNDVFSHDPTGPQHMSHHPHCRGPIFFFLHPYFWPGPYNYTASSPFPPISHVPWTLTYTMMSIAITLGLLPAVVMAVPWAGPEPTNAAAGRPPPPRIAPTPAPRALFKRDDPGICAYIDGSTSKPMVPSTREHEEMKLTNACRLPVGFPIQ
jgi:hypothetical protein